MSDYSISAHAELIDCPKIGCGCDTRRGCRKLHPSNYGETAKTETDKVTSDPVNNPAHYASGGVECIDAIQASMSVEAFRGYLRGNCFKYLWRFERKGGVEDLRKAEWYLKRLIKEASGADNA